MQNKEVIVTMKASRFAVLRKPHSDEYAEITLDGKRLDFDDGEDGTAVAYVLRKQLRGLKMKDVPQGISITPLARSDPEIRYVENLTVCRNIDGTAEIDFEDFITSKGWNLDLSPQKYARFLKQAVRFREKTVRDVHLINYDEDARESWFIRWSVDADIKSSVEEIIRFGNRVYGEVCSLQREIIIQNYPYLRPVLRTPTGMFLAHSSKDKVFTRRLAADLRARGIRVWLDEAEMLPGDSLIRKLEEGIKQMDYLAVILSPNSVRSGWVKREVEIALTEEIKGKRVKVIPILYRRCRLPGFVSSKVYADCTTNKAYTDALGIIIRRARGG
ncbi:MAG: toll/interleukin-1 receptor domain-containing protein [Candidatus Bathyarchaeia archaeon]|jgi:hypothetical protein